MFSSFGFAVAICFGTGIAIIVGLGVRMRSNAGIARVLYDTEHPGRAR